MTSNYSSIEAKAEETVYIIEMTHSIYLLHYITLTNYYIVQDKFR